MTKHYFFVGTYLPSLKLGEVPDITFEEFERLLKDNLTTHDYLQTRIIRGYFDILNFRALLKGEEIIDPYGNLNQLELEESIIGDERLPTYVLDFLHRYEKKEEQLSHTTELLADFFHDEIKDAKGFLKKYLIFERNLRLIFVALRAKKSGRDVALELQYEDPEEEVVAQILAQKDSKTYIPPTGYEEAVKIFEEYYDTPLEFHKAMTEYRFNKVDEIVGFDTFSFDRIMVYMVQLIMVEKWLELNKEKGLKIVDKIERASS